MENSNVGGMIGPGTKNICLIHQHCALFVFFAATLSIDLPAIKLPLLRYPNLSPDPLRQILLDWKRIQWNFVIEVLSVNLQVFLMSFVYEILDWDAYDKGI